MRYTHIPIFLALITLFMISCGTDSLSNEIQIQALLENSPYVGEGALQTSDDGTNDPNNQSPGLGSPYFPADVDSIPFTKWVRWIVRPVTWVYNIVVTGDTADATITTYFHGEPPGYGLFVINELSGPIWQRTIADSVIRKIKLYKDVSDDWHILSLTAAHMWTVGLAPTNPISITEVRARVDSRNYEFVINSPNTYFKKDELPTFLPNDTIEVTVTLNATGDSSWAFLHHGAGHRPGVGLTKHHRDPFYKDNTSTFSRTWYIADDSIVTTPAVRHTAVDVIIWEALFGDSTAIYQARAWGLPYIVKSTLEEDLPED